MNTFRYFMDWTRYLMLLAQLIDSSRCSMIINARASKIRCFINTTGRLMPSTRGLLSSITRVMMIGNSVFKTSSTKSTRYLMIKPKAVQPNIWPIEPDSCWIQSMFDDNWRLTIEPLNWITQRIQNLQPLHIVSSYDVLRSIGMINMIFIVLKIFFINLTL